LGCRCLYLSKSGGDRFGTGSCLGVRYFDGLNLGLSECDLYRFGTGITKYGTVSSRSGAASVLNDRVEAVERWASNFPKSVFRKKRTRIQRKFWRFVGDNNSIAPIPGNIFSKFYSLEYILLEFMNRE